MLFVVGGGGGGEKLVGGLQIACASRCSHRRLCACVTQGIVVARQLREHVTGGQCFAKALCTGRILGGGNGFSFHLH